MLMLMLVSMTFKISLSFNLKTENNGSTENAIHIHKFVNVVIRYSYSKIQIKRNVPELFDTNILEELIILDKLFKKCKNLQRHLQVSTVKYAKVHCKKVQVNL